MSYQEKNVTVSLVSHLLILGYYLFHWFQMYQEGGLVMDRVFRLWAIVIIATILVNILASILTNIVLSIFHAVRTGGEKDERFIEDERDKLISLKGTRISYIAFSIGVLLAMLSFVVGQPALVMFSLLIFSSMAGEILGDIAQIHLYRRGI
ncbi:MAG TPA: hypothetical protein VK900_00595 [Anaerolineales bacterium]|nr:hypothetical protein [Anaerolineales bacterium]